MMIRTVLGVMSLVAISAQADSLYGKIDRAVASTEPAVIEWRRQIHSNPELGNEEHETAALIAEQLRGLGFDKVVTGVAGTGVVAGALTRK